MAVLSGSVGQCDSAALEEVLGLLQLERLDESQFRGMSNDIGTPSVFGGLVLGQAVMAAGRTVPVHAIHSLHGYFIRPGDKHAPIRYTVERSRDGITFSTRSVTASQGGKAIFQMLASFQRAENGPDHQCAMPEAALPAPLEHERPRGLQRAILFRSDGQAPERSWMRPAGRLPDDPLLHHALLAYASDFRLLGAALRRHRLDPRPPNLHSVSLDHAMWFHRDLRFDDWLLYETDSPSASHARGLCRGSIFGRDGRLLASVAQEGLMRLR